MTEIFVADIGGTNCRFAIFNIDKQSRLSFVEELWLKTKSFNSFESLLAVLKSTNKKFSISNFEIIVLAVPAPVIGDSIINMVNIDWAINIKSLKLKHASSKIHFINDFTAQAYGCLTKAIDSAKIIKKGKLLLNSDIAVVGAGTGIGHGAIKYDERCGYIPLPSEAGQIAFPFTREEELKYRKFVIKITGCEYPTNDMIVSGPGISLLHRFFTGEDLPPEQVTGKISNNSETTEWFSRFYGRCCKNYCLSVLASGGKLVLSGGLAAKNEILVNNDIFREEFINSPLKADLLKQITVYLNYNEKIALWGAAQFCACSR